MIIEFEINGARVIVSGENLTVNVSEDKSLPAGQRDGACPTGVEIKAFRKSRSLSQSQFGKILGVDGPNVSRWENGRTRPRASAAILLRNMMSGEESE